MPWNILSDISKRIDLNMLNLLKLSVQANNSYNSKKISYFQPENLNASFYLINSTSNVFFGASCSFCLLHSVQE